MGTRFLVTNKSMAPDAYKQMIVDHGPEDLIVSSGVTGTDASWLRPSLIANGLDPDNLVAPSERRYGAGNKKWRDIWAAGQGLQTIRAIEPVADVVDRLDREYRDAFDRFAGLTQALVP